MTTENSTAVYDDAMRAAILRGAERAERADEEREAEHVAAMTKALAPRLQNVSGAKSLGR